MAENKAYINGYINGYMAAVRDTYGGDELAVESEIAAAFLAAAARLHAQKRIDFEAELDEIFGCLPVITPPDED